MYRYEDIWWEIQIKLYVFGLWLLVFSWLSNLAELENYHGPSAMFQNTA